MPINPGIISGLNTGPLQFQDPMDRFSKGLQLKQMMQAGQAQEQNFADEQATRQAYQQSGGDINKLRQLLTGGGQYRQLQALEKNQLETDKARTGIDKDKYDITAKAIAQHRDQLVNVNTPEQAAQWVMAGIRDPYTGPIMSRLGDPQAMIARIPTDPAGFEQWKKQSALGATKFIEMNKPHVNVQDVGNASNIVATPGLGGAPSVLSSTPKQQTPDSRAADARAREKLAQESYPKVQNSPAYKSALKELQRDEQNMASANQVDNAYKRWLELNQNVETGPIAGRRPVSFDNEYQELKQLENYLAVNNFKPGQGQISNFERTLIKGAGPSTTNDRETNKRIITINQGALQNMRDRADFREWYLEQNGKLIGSDRAWQQYLDKNPRYTVDNKTNALVPAKRQDWQSYFNAGGQIAEQSTAPARTIVKTGTYGGKKVIQYSDGTIDYAD